jgi:hypothetical protein
MKLTPEEDMKHVTTTTTTKNKATAVKCGHKDRPHLAFGLCRQCYARMRYAMLPEDREMRQKAARERYYSK